MIDWRNCIEIATQCEARPLRLKAEALLGKLLSDGEDIEPFLHDGKRSLS